MRGWAFCRALWGDWTELMRRLLAPFLSALALSPALSSRAANEGPVATAPAEHAPAAAPADPEARYQALLATAKASAPYSDWEGLRMAFAKRPGFQLTGQDVLKGEMFKAVEAADCAAALTEAKAVIAEAFVDADAHLVAAYCDEKQGDAAGATLERDIGLGLLKSIETGDGLSPASPFTVIDVDEELALMRAKGLKVVGQALVRQGGRAYDTITAADDKGESATYYFLVDRAQAKPMTPGAVSEADRQGAPIALPDRASR
jgi:hypothetical protein